MGTALNQYIDSLRYLRHNVDILIIAAHKLALSLLTFSGLQIAQVAIAEDIYLIGEGGGISLGLVFGVTGVGTGIGPLIARYFTGDRNRPLRLTIIYGYLIGAVGLAVAAPLINFGLVLFGTFLRGIGGGIVWVFSTQLLLHLVPNQVRGRVFATEFALFTLMTAAGFGIAGAATDRLGISGIIWWMAALTVIPAALWAFWIIREN